jgi:hypothetical protein
MTDWTVYLLASLAWLFLVLAFYLGRKQGRAEAVQQVEQELAPALLEALLKQEKERHLAQQDEALVCSEKARWN